MAKASPLLRFMSGARHGQGAVEIDGADHSDVPERLKVQEMVVAGSDRVGFACDRACRNPIIVVIRRNRVDREVLNNNFRDLL